MAPTLGGAERMPEAMRWKAFDGRPFGLTPDHVPEFVGGERLVLIWLPEAAGDPPGVEFIGFLYAMPQCGVGGAPHHGARSGFCRRP